MDSHRTKKNYVNCNAIRDGLSLAINIRKAHILLTMLHLCTYRQLDKQLNPMYKLKNMYFSLCYAISNKKEEKMNKQITTRDKNAQTNLITHFQF